MRRAIIAIAFCLLLLSLLGCQKKIKPDTADPPEDVQQIEEDLSDTQSIDEELTVGEEVDEEFLKNLDW